MEITGKNCPELFGLWELTKGRQQIDMYLFLGKLLELQVRTVEVWPPQCSCLGKPVDRGAWWAAAHGRAKSGT